MNTNHIPKTTNPDAWRYTPVAGKRPYLTKWVDQPHTFNEIDHPKDGFGLLLGPPSGGVVAIDFDGPLAWDHFSDELNLDIEDDPIIWTSWKKDRCQMAYIVPEDSWEHLRTIKINLGDKQGLEFRWKVTVR